MAVQFGDLVGPLYAQAVIPAHAAADATEDIPIFRAFKNARIRSVTLIHGAAITGVDTNTTHVNLKSWTDAATPVATERANRDYVDATDAVAMKAISLYAPATYLNLDTGQYLSLELEKVGTGLAIPDSMVVVEYDLAR